MSVEEWQQQEIEQRECQGLTFSDYTNEFYSRSLYIPTETLQYYSMYPLAMHEKGPEINPACFSSGYAPVSSLPLNFQVGQGQKGYCCDLGRHFSEGKTDIRCVL